MKSWLGNVLVLVRAYTYLVHHGNEGLKRVSEYAIINANYIQEKLKDIYEVPFYAHCMHEFVASAEKLKHDYGVTAKLIDKKLLEKGIHAPTTYFPMTVHEALMIEPTETESKETIDQFIEVMRGFHEEMINDLETFKKLNPDLLQIINPDETVAARKLTPRWYPN